MYSGNVVPKEQGDKILDIPSALTKGITGKLTICKGMPVLLKWNNATELDMTNGTEATVRSWKSSMLPDGRPILDVIFVELKAPPTPVKLEGLPLNVVLICCVK